MTEVIRPFQASDWPALWSSVLAPTFRRGDTYAFAADIGEDEAQHVWTGLPAAIFVACDPHGAVLGSYFLKANQPGQGSHVCNCGYVVADAARGRGLAARLCEHSQQQALAMGFDAMQFNFVVSTNEGAVRLWQRMGFEIVGTLPGAFRHPQRGDVDAYVMFKKLK